MGQERGGSEKVSKKTVPYRRLGGGKKSALGKKWSVGEVIEEGGGRRLGRPDQKGGGGKNSIGTKKCVIKKRGNDWGKGFGRKKRKVGGSVSSVGSNLRR